MKSFITKHAKNIKGVLHCFDRIILRGYLPIASRDYFFGWLTFKKLALNLKKLPDGWRSFSMRSTRPFAANQGAASDQQAA